MDGRVTPPKLVTSPTWGPLLHVNRLLEIKGAEFTKLQT